MAWPHLMVLAAMAADPIDVRRDATVRAVESVMPSVVNVSTEQVIAIRDPFEDLLRDFWGPHHGRREPDVRYSLGSGVIIDDEGHLLTNDHVVRRATRVRIKLSDGREFEAEPVARSTPHDLALLKIKAPAGAKFRAVPFAAPDDLLLAETVVALGNPFGLGGSVSRGILSSKERRTPREHETLDVTHWLQTDAAINPGNSGGPLINLNGELIGINVAVFRDAQGIGFAIPIKRVNEALSDFFSPESMHGLWFGARLTQVAGRLMVMRVEAESPAARAGLLGGDRILGINGKTGLKLIGWGRELGTGKKVPLTVERAGKPLALFAAPVPERDFFNASIIKRRLGLAVRPLTRELAEQMGQSFFGGFLVDGVDEGGAGWKLRIERGQVIQSVDGQLVSDVVAFAKAVYALAPGDKLRLGIVTELRRGNFVQRHQGVATLTVP